METLSSVEADNLEKRNLTSPRGLLGLQRAPLSMTFLRETLSNGAVMKGWDGHSVAMLSTQLREGK